MLALGQGASRLERDAFKDVRLGRKGTTKPVVAVKGNKAKATRPTRIRFVHDGHVDNVAVGGKECLDVRLGYMGR